MKHVTLAGHSYAGLVITGVADRIPERSIASCISIPYIPVSGKSLYGIIEMCGTSYQKFNLISEKPFIEPLFYNEERYGRLERRTFTVNRMSLRWAAKLLIRCSRTHSAISGNILNWIRATPVC
jgi:hypothetical protein